MDETVRSRPADVGTHPPRRCSRRARQLLHLPDLRPAGGHARGNSFDLPLTQQELADTMGMSLVHMNRTLRGLRSRELITTNGHTVTVENPRALMNFAAFDPLYLHQQAHKFRSSLQGVL
ncbi:winged helix-turn-helix domain-containing protein [Mesorhizobium sp. B2-5-9]|nr:winged helix-turn-helix domain-containing protein [Mesorhizobium sp. B2-5-9]